MQLFRRRKRAAVGTYVEPPGVPPLPPVDRIVDEGVLIATSAVRMATKNRIIVAALRDGLPFDPDELALGARREFLVLARRDDDSADRMQRRWGHGEGRSEDETTEFERNMTIVRSLARELRATAHNRAAMALTVTQARDDAWHEVAGAIEARLVRLAEAERDPHYEREREGRIHMLIAFDLRDLDIERGGY